MYPGKTEPMIKTPPTPPSVAMAWQTMTITTGWRCTRTMQRTQPQRDICNQTQPPWNVAESIPQSQGNAPIDTEPMIKNTTHSSIGCNGIAPVQQLLAGQLELAIRTERHSSPFILYVDKSSIEPVSGTTYISRLDMSLAAKGRDI